MVPAMPMGKSRNTRLAARLRTRDRLTMRRSGMPGCLSAKLPSAGWHTMPARHRTAMSIPASPLVNPRAVSSAA